MSASWCNVRYCYLTFGVKLHHCRHWRLSDRLILTQCQNGILKDGTFSQKRTKITSGTVPVTYDRDTPEGEKKDVSDPLPSSYSPSYVEAAWYNWWVKQGYFSPDYKAPWVTGDREKFIVCLPPPNVTGTLHLGHALTNSIEDALVRWNRMRGKQVLWIPGCDHAGIATQVVVEKKLWKDMRVTRHDLGREKFVEEVWKWKEEKGDTIFKQMEKLGSSLDWSRSVFTMDTVRSRAVVEAFVRLYEDNLIYRSKRMVNWSCHLKSVISDIEVENMAVEGRIKLQVPGYENPVEFGTITSFAYPVENSYEKLVVATTRPETMLGDTAVAVHPDDQRYTHLHGEVVINPLNQRRIRIICDEFVDKEFGTGAVKITPAHDYTDNEVGQRHNLPEISVIDDTGHMHNVPEEFLGLRRFDARSKVIEVLKEKDLYRGTRKNPMVVPLCSRSKDVVEPCLKEQWFLNYTGMAQKAVKAVEDGELKFIPEHFVKTWNDWLSKSEDWCISRQLWWGHRIPAYHASAITQDGETKQFWIIARDTSEAFKKASSQLGVPENQIQLKQDEDVLDTWFSSALFPFSAHGWPDMTEDLAHYYPSTLLETGHDIIFFWVARMVMLGYKLTGKVPFSDVLLHGILRDAQGRKMSKSLGNVIDPMDVMRGISLEDLHKQIEGSLVDPAEVEQAKAGQRKDFPQGIPEVGADALRFTLCSYAFKSQEINLDIARAKTNRAFCNKIWQAFIFVQMKLPEDFVPEKSFQFNGSSFPWDAWILSRLSNMVKTCDKHFHSYDLQLVTKALQEFWVLDFCNVYVECTKHVFNSGDPQQTRIACEILHFCVQTFLHALSPFMPFLTEELYQRLQARGENWSESICIAPYPQPEQYKWQNSSLDSQVEQIKSISAAVSTICIAHKLNKKMVKAFVWVADKESRRSMSQFLPALPHLFRINSVTLIADGDPMPSAAVRKQIQPGVEVHIPLTDLIDPVTELERQIKRRDHLLVEVENLKKKLANDGKRSQENQLVVQNKIISSEQKLEDVEFAIEVIRKIIS